MKHLLLGFVADGTRVVQNQVGCVNGFHLGVTLLHERADHLLRVMHIHLAAEGLEVKRFLCGRHRAQYIPANLVKTGVNTNGTKERKVNSCVPVLRLMLRVSHSNACANRFPRQVVMFSVLISDFVSPIYTGSME